MDAPYAMSDQAGWPATPRRPRAPHNGGAEHQPTFSSEPASRTAFHTHNGSILLRTRCHLGRAGTGCALCSGRPLASNWKGCPRTATGTYA